MNEKWEYLVITTGEIEYKNMTQEKVLEIFGRDGWILCTIMQYDYYPYPTMYFRRQIAA